MTTLGSIHANDLVIVMISVLAVTVLYILYCAVQEKKKDINFKVLGALAFIVSAVMVPIQKYYYSGEESKILNKFASGDDIVCRFNENSNIVISKKRGYELKNRFFIKDEMAIKLGSCYLLE